MTMDKKISKLREDSPSANWRMRIGLILGPCLFLLLLLTEPPAGMELSAWRVAALTALMAVWWVTEAVPIPVTALLPVALLPPLGVVSISVAAAPYANPLIFLFLGGFLIALAIQRWDLHRRIALFILRFAGQKLHFLVAGFMLATGFLSMWVSNTATAALMLPISISVLLLLESREEDPSNNQNFALALLLGIAFAANIGGMATLIGTPPNALLAGYMAENYDVHIGFAQWMLVGLPVASLMMLLAWLVLTRWAFPVSRRNIEGIKPLLERQRADLGPPSRAEWRVGMVFLLVALAWIFRPLLEKLLPGLTLSDAGIAIMGALLLFLIPANQFRQQRFLLDWESTKHLPWGVLVLVGGGLSLGAAIDGSGLSAYIAAAMGGLGALPSWLLVGTVVVITMLLSHVTSNTATAATLLPLTAALAVTLNEHPLLLAIPVALAASCAFMLPVATPPNAIVFSSERITVPDMVRAGYRLSIAATVIISAAVFLLAIPVLGFGR